MMNEGRPVRAPQIGLASGEAPTQQLGLSPVGDRCAGCGSMLSSDQRYCVNCGERRSQPRFSLADPPVAATPTVMHPSPAPRQSRGSSSGTFVAGVATLLLAMGVGVLIGRTNTSSPPQKVSAAPATVVTVGGGAATATTAAGTPPSSPAKKSRASSKSKAQAKASTAKPSAATAGKAAAAATKVLGAGNLPPATVTQGASGSGPGYTNHKFTGTFFGQ
jgi:hypothetical protein